ncbi:hypothetical protein PUMCH_004325 [Australozyma saopauloensis]|uniref:Vacuolar membrane protein n=1 Tax=Australozyma saopauloensis TaxID=291208 RepID=A0AAX4HEG9_9ASCO|nr:hypothetical protein PUMCH_004325 [[Candida] saopauloensis]
MYVETFTTSIDPLVLRRDDKLPALNTGTTTSTQAPSTTNLDQSSTATDSSLTSQKSAAPNLANLPQMSSSKAGGLPGLPTLTTTSATSATFTTPAIDVPSIKNNPFISSTNKPRGTVFIGVGSAVAAVLVLFGLYNLIKSFMASSLAKKTVNNEKRSYQRFADNAAYRDNNRSSTVFDNLTTVGSRLPPGPGSYTGSQYEGSNSFFELMPVTSHQDLTNMFISPTREVMTGHSRSLADSQVNVSTLGSGRPGLNAIGNRSSQHMPSMYFHEGASNSTVGAGAVPTRTPERRRRAVPSMYLEDLVDDDFNKQISGENKPSP